MSTRGKYSITGGMPDGADTATLTIRAYYGAVYVDRTIFVSKARTGSQGNPGTTGGAGAPSVVLSVSRPQIMILTYAEGTPVDPTFSGDDGQLIVYEGGTDVTYACALSVVQNGCSGSINSALNIPVAAHAMGYYRVTNITADNASLQLNAVYKGITFSSIVSVTKAKGGYEIVGTLPTLNLFDGRMVFLTTDGKLYRYYQGHWTTAVPALDIAGQLADAQIASLNGAKIMAATIYGGSLVAQTITGDLIQANTINADRLTANSITANQLSSGALITASAQITDGVIISAKIGDLQVNSAKIQDLTVGTTKITGNAVTQMVSSVLAANVATTTNFPTDVLECAYTPATNSPIKLDVTVDLFNQYTTSAVSPQVSIRRFQSGGEVSLWTGTLPPLAYQTENVVSITLLDTIGNTLARTYRIYVYVPSQVQVKGTTTTIIVQEFKK